MSRPNAYSPAERADMEMFLRQGSSKDDIRSYFANRTKQSVGLFMATTRRAIRKANGEEALPPAVINLPVQLIYYEAARDCPDNVSKAAAQGSLALLQGYVAYARKYHPGTALAGLLV